MLDRLRSHLNPSIQQMITFVVVFVSVIFVFSQVQPSWIFTDTTTAGGDMGAHVWAPQYLRDHLLSHGRISGWSPDWYNGFPALFFYFPLPAVMVVALNVILPYGVAFKLITISGVLSLPVAAWAFGRLARLPFPAPACLAAATVPFLFDTGYTIMGGNIASTLAGEYAFSIGLSLSFVFLGLVAGGLESGKRKAWAAVVFFLIIICHILPTIFAFVGGSLLLVMRLVSSNPSEEIDEVPVIEAAPEPDVPSEPTDIESITALSAPILISTPPKSKPRRVLSTRRSSFGWAVAVCVLGTLLSAFWLVPFVLQSGYMNDMGWEKIGTGVKSGMTLYGNDITTYSDALFPFKHIPANASVMTSITTSFKGLGWVLIFAFVSSAIGLYLRRRITIFFTLLALIYAFGFRLMPQGRLWNARLLPFWYFCLYILCGLLFAEISVGVKAFVSKYKSGDGWGSDISTGIGYVTPIGALVGAVLICTAGLQAPQWWNDAFGSALWHNPSSSEAASFVPSWAEWNYKGYQEKGAAYDEYKTLVNTMDEVGKTDGCGRAMWEYENSEDRFGTPMALMLLPMWTHSCIGSEEGLFFESSATVPYHFLDQSELSQAGSQAMRNLPYQPLNVTDGITKLQLLGVKYYIAVTPEAQSQAAADTRLNLLASVFAAPGTDGSARTWNVYEIADSDIVAPLVNKPAVLTDPNSIKATFKLADRQAVVPGDGTDDATVTSDTTDPTASTDSTTTSSVDPKANSKLNPRDSWLGNSVTWYQASTNYSTLLAASGPQDWPRIANANDALPAIPTNATATVKLIATGDDRISFDVDQIGQPMLVKTSYFPNWQVSGAKGPYRVSPNLMVVIPTSKHVELHFGRTSADHLGMALTLLGIVGVAVLFRRERRDRESRLATATAGASAPSDGFSFTSDSPESPPAEPADDPPPPV